MLLLKIVPISMSIAIISVYIMLLVVTLSCYIANNYIAPYLGVESRKNTCVEGSSCNHG